MCPRISIAAVGFAALFGRALGDKTSLGFIHEINTFGPCAACRAEVGGDHYSS